MDNNWDGPLVRCDSAGFSGERRDTNERQEKDQENTDAQNSFEIRLIALGRNLKR